MSNEVRKLRQRAAFQNETGICKKLLGEHTTEFYCLDCLAEYLEVTPQDILDKIEEFRGEGCRLFD